MQNVLTNTPPVDSDLLNKKNVSKPRLVDVGKPRPAPKPVLVDVGKPKPAPKTKLVDVGKPKLPTIEQLVQQIDSDLNFVPSKSQIKEYFAYKDKQPFGFKKTWDATVNAVGTALGDMTKAVGSAVTDPDFYNPISKKKYATLAEGFARGSWDLATLGRMMTDKFQEVAGDPSERERVKYIVKRHNEEYPDDKVSFMQVFNSGNKDFKNPKDYNRYYSDFKDNLTEKRIERWRTMRYILNTRNLAREGKKTILGEFLGEKADKELLPNINQEVAEGSSYFLDPTLPVGIAATPLKAGQKSVVTRGITAPVLEKSGRRIKETGKWIDETIAKLETKAAENADIVEPAATVSSAVGGAVLAPESVGPVAGAVAGAIGGKYGLPKLGTVTKIGKPITIAGEGIEAIGKVIGKPETLESTLQQASRIAESESARKILKKAANLDPAITLVDNLAVGAIEGSKAGGILALPSGEEEFIGGAIGTGGAMGGIGSVSGNVIGDKSRTQQQAKNTVEAWIESKSKDERKAIQDLRLSPIEAANVAMAELLGRGIIGDGKISDINFVYLSQPEYIKKIHPELMIDGKAPDVLPAGTRGAQSSVDGTPTVFINSGYDGPRSIFHEMMHAMLKFDEMSDSRTELRSVLFDQKTDDGTVLKEGMYSDGDIDVFFDQYLSRLPEEIRDSWEEQFNVLREEGAEKTLVVDKEATLDAKRQYIMEEVEAESFANFIKESGPTFLRGSRTIRQRIVDRFLLQDNLKKTRLLRAVLEKSGVPFGADGNPTGVFWKDGKPISNNRELNRVMRDFVRAKDSVTRRMMEDEGGETPSLSIGAKRKAEGRKKVEIALKSKDGKLLVSHFKNNDTFKREKNGEIKYDALTGEPILLGEKEIQALQENRANQIQDALDAIDDPSGMTPKVSEVDGKISWSGIPSDAQLKAILDIPNDIIPPGMKDTITDIVEKMKTPGQSIIIDYNPAMGSGKRYSSNLSSGLRIAVPLGFHVSQSKNFYITTLDLGAMNIKLSDWGNPDSKTHKNLDLWNGDSKLFRQDMFKYLENHKNGRPGESGLDANPATAETKRNIINDFFGVTGKDYNPITDARKASKRTGKQRKVENIIRSRRFDRINKIEKNRITKYGAGTPLPMKTQSDAYKKLKENLMPGGGLEPQASIRPPVDDLGFYSRVAEVAASDKIPNRGSGDQMLATIKKQPGVKQEELQWLGLEDYLRGKKQVTKQELTDFIRENDIQLEETILSGDHYDSFSPDKQTDFARYEEYQLPGAEDGSYREMLLRMPNEKESGRDLLGEPEKISTEESVEYEGANDYFDEDKTIDNYFIPEGYSIENRKDFDDGEGNVPEYITSEWNILDDRTDVVAEGSTPEEAVANLHRKYSRSYLGDLKPVSLGSTFNPARIDHVLKYDGGFEIGVRADGKYDLELRDRPRRWATVSDDLAMFEKRLADFAIEEGIIDGVKTKNFRSSHFDEPNVLAHVRFNDRTGPNGEKILFVEELQSDWHREGRKLGYASSPDKPGIPDAPFKSSWHELATKRMLRYAAENGYDKLAFIDGAETANRYDLSKKISEVMYNETTQALHAYDKTGENVLLKRGVPPEKIADYIGKEPAERLLNQPLDKMPAGAELEGAVGGKYGPPAKVKTKRLRGEDLKIGGDWAFNLYDRMIPQFLKKYGKKFGAKVEDVRVSTDGNPWRRKPPRTLKNFKAIDITPQMRGEDGVMGGQVRFMPGVEKFDTVEPSIISESVKIKPGALDGVRFMPGTAPRIPLSQVADSDPFIMLSDRMADMVYEVPGSGVRIPIHGGPGFSYRDGKAVWASTRNAAKKIGNYVNNSGKNRALIMIQRDDNHAKNPSMGRIFVEELKAREKNITKTDMNKMLRAASKRAGLKKSVKNLNELESLYTFWDWDTRGNFFGQFGLVNKPHSPIGDPRKRGFFDYHQIIKDTTDPALADLPTGSIVGAIEFDGGKVYEASELGTVPHSSYDTMLKGRGLGLFENPPHISDILDVPENQRSVFTLSRRFTSPNRLKEAAKLEVDKIIKIPAKKKVQRKDRAMEILKQFSKNKNANRNTKKAQ
jgi:hypothetical protein